MLRRRARPPLDPKRTALLACALALASLGYGCDVPADEPAAVARPDLGGARDLRATASLDDGGDLPSGDGGACGKPGTLHPPKAGQPSLYCPFGAGGKASYCQAGAQHCCEPSLGGGDSSCQPAATPCGAKDTDWACQDPSDCGPGRACCSNAGAGFGSGAPGCANYATRFTGTACQAACTTSARDAADNQLVLCTRDDQCGPGQACAALSTKGVQVGACR